MAERIKDRYEALDLAGKGGQGEVLRALDHQHDRIVALKIRTIDGDRDEILSEARTLLGLRPHPNLPLVREDFFEDSRYVMVVDWVEGKSLQQVLEERGDPGLPAQSVLSYLRQIADAIDHLHRHSPPIVHQDVKPANAILTPDGGVVLVDFGIAGAAGETASAGTRGYQAPEIAAGARATPASDIYSLGATAFALLTGAPPEGARPGWEGVALEGVGVIERALRRALASDPARRPATAGELVDQLRAWLDAALPVGTVTFLLTDVAGSAAQWEEHPAEMAPAVARLTSLVAEAVESNGGRLLKSQGEGDATFSVFADPRAAAKAAIAAQVACAKAKLAVPVSMRAALHTGEAQLREGDYFGAAVGRATRLRAIAHGGQILASEATAELIRDGVPEGARMRDLGPHRLRDLARPERVFQLGHETLEDNFPALTSLDAVANNLPSALTHFIGREQELALGRDVLAKTRLLTVTGLGGAGKTRLALQLAAEEFDRFADGVWFVELASLADGALIPEAVAETTGARVAPGESPLDALLAHFRARTALIVLDTCEHVIADCARFAETLLRACKDVKIVATSTEPVAIPGEALLPVPPLPVPPDAVDGAGHVLRFGSVELFAERARQAKPSFAVTDANATAIAQICRTLDGIPLALELAAARVKVLTAEQIAARLDDRFRLLAGGSRTALPHQQTLRAAMDWSHDLLTQDDRILFRRLGVFAGGCTLEGAEAVCGDESLDSLEILDRLASLIDRSLIAGEEHDSEIRYRMLTTVHLYARDRLADAGEGDTFKGRHLDFYVALGRDAAQGLTGASEPDWLRRLRAETDDIRAALEWSIQSGRTDEGLSLARALRRFWLALGRYAEARSFVTRALERSGKPPSIDVSLFLGVLAWNQGDGTVARASYEAALSAARAEGRADAQTFALNGLGALAVGEGDFPRARTLFEECLAIARASGQDAAAADAVTNLGVLLEELGDLPAARTYKEQALEAARRLGDLRAIDAAVTNLGVLALKESDFEQAQRWFEEGLSLCRELGNLPRIVDSLGNVGEAARKLGDARRARACFDEALALARELGDEQRIAEVEALISG